MDALGLHRRAQDVFAGVLDNVRADQLGNPSPCTEWDARAVIEHVIRGNQRVLQLAGLDPATLPDDLCAAHTASAAAAHAVFAAPDGLSRRFDLPFAQVPGAAFIGIRSSDVFTHAWDLAKATGQPTALDPDVAKEALATARVLLPSALRGPGRPFGDERPCPDGASAADELAAFLGRDVLVSPT